MMCDIFEKDFKRRHNMLRHKRIEHAQEQDSDTEQSEDIHHSESTNDSCSEDNTPQYDQWNSHIQKAFEQCCEEFEEAALKLTQRNKLDGAEARHQAYENLRSSYRKTLVHVLTS